LGAGDEVFGYKLKVKLLKGDKGGRGCVGAEESALAGDENGCSVWKVGALGFGLHRVGVGLWWWPAVPA